MVKEWKNVGRIQGDQGPKGDQGEQGPKGDQGEQGPKGENAVVESGSNENGDYVKFEDGTMMCWHRFEIDVVEYNEAGALYRSSDSFGWDYPQEFISGPVISVDVSSTATWATRTSSGSDTNVSFRVFSTGSSPNNGLLVHIMAIGRWL